MISPLFVLAATALALPQAAPTPTAQPYIVAKASDIMVNYAVNHRKSNVAENAARSAAVEIVNSALAPPQATELVKSAAKYYMANGATVAGTQAEKLASQASSYYDTLATKPAYQNFAKLVNENINLFDISGAVNSAQSKLIAEGQLHNSKANKLIAKADTAYSSLKADPAGAKAIATGRQLARQVAKDFKVDPEPVKARARQAKSDVIELLTV